MCPYWKIVQYAGHAMVFFKWPKHSNEHPAGIGHKEISNQLNPIYQSKFRPFSPFDDIKVKAITVKWNCKLDLNSTN